MTAKASFRELYAKEREALLQQIKQEQTARLTDISEQSLIWLALVPAWTLRLAEEAGFPASAGLSVAATLTQIEAAGYCKSSIVSAPLDETDNTAAEEDDAALRCFLMPTTTRTEVLQNFIQDITRGLPELQKEMKVISAGIARAQTAGVPLPEGVERWAKFASFADNAPQLTAWFDEQTETLLKGNAPGELLRWIEVARPLEELLGIELSIALGRAARRLELYHRLADDKRRLVKFLKRDEQVQAFKELLENPEKGWALHYIGSGGVGKTMLIRYLTAELASQFNISTARIDFDYLNPDYPARAPGLLLAQLAEELRVYDRVGAAARLFATFIEKMLNLHERLGAEVGAQFSLAAVMAPIYDTLPHFVEALSQLPQPVVIILDTCEELSKIRVDGTIPPSVDATFSILERLHEMFPNLRIVFSGRRPLASVGAGWTVPGAQLPARPYLRAHEILGFTAAEAEQYLGKIEQVQPDAIQPIIKHSLKEQERGLLSWNLPLKLAKQSVDAPRYNPFDLSLYAAWLREDPKLTLDAIKSADVDRYIDMRIVRRLKHRGVRALLPVVTLLGRSDFNTLRAVSGLDAAQFNNVFIDLSNQEWISRHPPQVLEVDRGLQPRLLAYLKRTEPVKLEEKRRAISDYLEDHTVEGDHAQLEAAHFSTAFRLLKDEPQRALLWWEQVERRFATEEAYDWLKNVCELIMGEEGDVPGTDAVVASPVDVPVLLRAAVRASYAAALTHTGPFDRIDDTWAEALLLLTQHPQPNEAARLTLRARTGRLAAAASYNKEGPDTEEVNWLWQTLGQLKRRDLDTQLTSSFIAAAEAVIESFESESLKAPPPPAVSEPQALINFADVLSGPDGYQEPARFACTLAGRLLVLAGRKREALLQFERALKLELQTGAQPTSVVSTTNFQVTPQTWLDWRAPEQLDARIALEFIRHTYPVLSAAQVLATFDGNIPTPATIDSDRLASALIQLRATTGMPLLGESSQLARRSRYAVQHEATCHAHRRYPPLFAAVAEALAAEGRVDEALGMLQAQAGADEQNVENFASVQEADRACLRIIQRMRLRDEGQGASTSLDKSNEWQDVARLWAIDALGRPQSSTLESGNLNLTLSEVARGIKEQRQILHARYRTINALDESAANLFIRMFRKSSEPPAPDATFAELSLFLDSLELKELAARHKLGKLAPQLRLGQLKVTRLWRDASTPSIERFVLLLRHAALDASKETILNIDKSLVAAIGYRGAARVALEEGELLALRLPDRAVRLLDQAHRWYERAKDHVGAFVAKVCAALALARSSSNVALSRALSKVQQGYVHRLTKKVVSLPKWSALTAFSADPQPKSFERLGPRGWRPWLARLVACLTWQKDGYRTGTRTQALVRVLETTYGVMSEGKLVLPTELDGWLNASQSAAVEKQAERKPVLLLAVTQAKRSSVWQSLESSLEVELALQGSEKQVKARVFIEGLTPYRAAARGLLTRLEKDDEAFLRDFTTLAAQPVIKLQVEQPVSWPCWEGLVGLALQELLKTADALRPCQRLVRDSKTRRVASWPSVRRALTWTNDLSLTEMARTGWGELTSGSAFSHEIRDSEFVRSHRYKTKAPQVLHIIGTPTETSSGVRLDLSTTRQWRSESRGHGTGSGSNQRISQGTGSGSGSGYGGTGSGSTVAGGSIGTGGRGELIKSYDLISFLPQMAMCILQAIPRSVGGGSARTRTEREQAAYLRLMGAELFRLGVPVVITIPPLAVEGVTPVLKSIVNSFQHFQKPMSQSRAALANSPLQRALPKQWDTKGALLVFLEAIAEAQTLMRTFTPVPEDDRVEAAYDICLYAADTKA